MVDGASLAAGAIGGKTLEEFWKQFEDSDKKGQDFQQKVLGLLAEIAQEDTATFIDLSTYGGPSVPKSFLTRSQMRGVTLILSNPTAAAAKVNLSVGRKTVLTGLVLDVNTMIQIPLHGYVFPPAQEILVSNFTGGNLTDFYAYLFARVDEMTGSFPGRKDFGG